MEMRTNTTTPDLLHIATVIKSHYRLMTIVHLDTGTCERFYLDAADGHDKVLKGDYNYYISKTIKETIYEEDLETFRDVFSLSNLRRKAKSVKDHSEFSCQYRMKTPEIIWIECRIFLIRQNDQTVVANILGRDITEEKLKEAAEKSEKIQNHHLINSLSCLFFSTHYIDLKADTCRMVTQSEESGTILDTVRNYTEAIHSYAQQSIHPDDRNEYLKRMERQNLLKNLNTMNPFIAVEFRQSSSGANASSQYNEWIRATVVLAETENGVPKKALYVVQNVTESKQKEEQERKQLKDAYDAVYHANTTKKAFLSAVSHDIRTPMNAIIGMTAIASRHLDDRKRLIDCLDKISISSRHLLSLISEVLDMNEIESGKIDLMEEEFDLPHLIHNLLAMVRQTIGEKQHKLELRITNVEHENVIGDAIRLQQVFINILGNAVNYTPPGGILELDISEKTSELSGYGCYEFIFQDNGFGMPEEFLSQIFEPFSRAEDIRISKIEGSGLGLAIALNIVQMMNGDIRVESKLNEGSRFIVTVFLKQRTTTFPNVEELSGLPLLVVENDIYSCEAVCSLLNDMGLKTDWELRGKEAVKRVRSAHQNGNDFFAVILDWEMPDMDGIQTAKKIQKELGTDAPLMVLSAHDWADMEEETYQNGLDGYISKPLFKSKLISLLKELRSKKNIPNSHISESAPKPEEIDLSQKRVLLVDDVEINREIAIEIIESTGVKVDSVENGKQAFEKFRDMGEWYYDLIFMDIQMPIMNGYEATEAIRSIARDDARQIPILAMTADAFTEDIIACQKAGMNEHIAKPLSVEHVIGRMKYWFGAEHK